MEEEERMGVLSWGRRWGKEGERRRGENRREKNQRGKGSFLSY